MLFSKSTMFIMTALLLWSCTGETDKNRPTTPPPAPASQDVKNPPLPPIEKEGVSTDPPLKEEKGDNKGESTNNDHQVIPAVGSFHARQKTTLGSQISGRVQSVLVDVGDMVREGQELVLLERSLFEIEAAQKKAEVAAARAAMEEAKINYTRMKNLWEKPEGEQPSVPRKTFDDAKSRYDTAKARFNQSDESLRLAEERLQETVIRAPYDAVVTKRMIDPGEPVTSAPIIYLLEIQEVSTLELEFSLPQELMSKVRKGTPVEFEVEGIKNGKGTGKISVIFPSLDEATRSFRCRVLVKNQGLRFKPGLLAQVRVNLKG